MSDYNFKKKQMGIGICHKVVFIGDSSVGKTSIINQYLYNSCSPEHSPTIGIDFFLKVIEEGEKSVRIQIWDTAGQEKFRALIPSYIRNSTVAILVYDITNRTSFDNIQKWRQNIIDTSDPHLILVGNKIDLDSEREITKEEGELYAKQINADFIETSARTPIGITDLFGIVADLPLPVINESETTSQQTTITVVIDPPKPADQSFCSC